jgi:hypothetical protein
MRTGEIRAGISLELIGHFIYGGIDQSQERAAGQRGDELLDRLEALLEK